MSLRRFLRERGSASVELIAFVPILFLVTVLIIQGFIAMSAVSAAQASARDGARALAAGTSATSAANASLPSWLKPASVTSCGSGCVTVTVDIPVGVPPVTVTHVQVSRSATFRTN